MVLLVGLQSVLVASPGHIYFLFFLYFFFQKRYKHKSPSTEFFANDNLDCAFNFAIYL